MTDVTLPFDTSSLSKADQKLLGQTLQRAGEIVTAAQKDITKAATVMVEASKVANEKAERSLTLFAELDQLDQAAQARFGGSIFNDSARGLIEQGRQAAQQFTVIADQLKSLPTAR